MSDLELRVFAYIDRLQSQTAAHIAATGMGDVPVEGMAELFIEVAPGNAIFRVADIALKAADVAPSLQIVEREFGLLEIHAANQESVLAAGEAVTGQTRPGLTSCCNFEAACVAPVFL